MGEGGGGSRIGQIISRYVHSLYGGDGSLLGGGDTLLHTTHISGEGRLVTYSRGDTTQKRRHLGTGLSETEDVVDEKEHILTFFVTEVLSNGKTGQSDTGTGTGGLVHLTEDESDLGVTLEVDDTGLNHFVVQVVTLTSAFTDTLKISKFKICLNSTTERDGKHTTEDRETTMGLGDVVDEFLNKHSLSDTSTSEETNFSTTSIGGEQVDDLDTSLEDLSGCGLVDEWWRVSVNGGLLYALDGTPLIDGLTNDVHDTTQGSRTNGDHDGSTGIDDLLATDETLGTVHSNSTDAVLTKMGSNLEDETTSVEVLNFESVQDRREILRLELHIDDGTDDGLDGTNLMTLCLSSIVAD